MDDQKKVIPDINKRNTITVQNIKRNINYMSLDFQNKDPIFKNYKIFDEDTELYKLQFTNKKRKNINQSLDIEKNQFNSIIHQKTKNLDEFNQMLIEVQSQEKRNYHQKEIKKQPENPLVRKNTYI